MCHRYYTDVPYLFSRWGNTPLDDAMQFGHDVIASVLQEYQLVFTDKESEEKTPLDTLKSII